MLNGINLIIGIVFASLIHPLHVSFTNLEFNEENQEWEITVKLFKDDFALDLKNMYGYSTVIEEDEKQGEGEYFRKYLEDCLEISYNNVPLKVKEWKYEGKKVNFEAVWLIYTFCYNEEISSVRIVNRLMFGLFDDQKNLLIFSYKGEQKAFQFRYKDAEIMFTL
jgi:hypothetical protein